MRDSTINDQFDLIATELYGEMLWGRRNAFEPQVRWEKIMESSRTRLRTGRSFRNQIPVSFGVTGKPHWRGGGRAPWSSSGFYWILSRTEASSGTPGRVRGDLGSFFFCHRPTPFDRIREKWNEAHEISSGEGVSRVHASARWRR
jgi:hypothetical protein